MKKIGRNDPCPCGSGLKYKKCCLNSNSYSHDYNEKSKKIINLNEFPFIDKKVKELKLILSDYHFEDLVKSIFCININIYNRSSLENILALNLFLSTENRYGNRRIDNYEEFKKIFNKIKNILKITLLDDNIIEDFGEVCLYYNNRKNKVILGTGYEQTYGSYQFIKTVVEENNSKNNFIQLLEYSSNMINYFKEINAIEEQELGEINFKLPSEKLFLKVQKFFDEELNYYDLKKISKLFSVEKNNISKQHFIEKNGNIYPLFNPSILLDFYNEEIKNKTNYEISKIVDFTIYNILSVLSKIDDKENPSIVYPVSLFDEKMFISNYIYSFILLGNDEIIVGLNRDRFSHDELKKEIKLINKLHDENKLIFAEIPSNNKNKKTRALKVGKNKKIKFIIYNNITELTNYKPITNNDKYFQFLALDVIYLLFFMSDNNELIRFIDYLENITFEKINFFGGIANLYLYWKKSGELIQKGAITYNTIYIEYGFADKFVWEYFKKNLNNFPYKEDDFLFSDFYGWNIKYTEEGFYEYANKINQFYRGHGKKYKNNCFIFYVYNGNFFNKKEISDTINQITLTEDLNFRNAKLYNNWFESNSFFNDMKIQFLFMPKYHAVKIDNTGFCNDNSKKYVYSDMFKKDNNIIIRYCINKDQLYKDIENSVDRSVESQYYIELLKPLQDLQKKEYDDLVSLIKSNSFLSKGVGIFSLELDYLWNDKGGKYQIKDKTYHLIRRRIAKICKESGILKGEFVGKEANKIIRKIQYKLISDFELKILEFNMLELHKELLSIYSQIIHDIYIHLKRYSNLDDIDEQRLIEFKNKTIELREKEKHNKRIVSYAIETNISLKKFKREKTPSQEDVEYILAYSNWLVVLFDTADICYNSDYDQHIRINNDYVIDIIETDEISHGLKNRIYDNVDYGIKNDEEDKKYLDKVIEAFNLDTGIKMPLMFSLLEYLQLLPEKKYLTEINPNVYLVNKMSILEGFINFYDDYVNIEEVSFIIDYLIVEPEKLKFWKGKIQEFLPINERVERDNRFDMKPIIKQGEELIYSTVIISELRRRWISGIFNFYLPFEIGLKKTIETLEDWKKRYENLIIYDLKIIFENNGFEYLKPNVWLHKLDKNGDHPYDLGDYDLLAYDSENSILWVIECKVLSKVGSIHEFMMQQKNFFSKYDHKFQKRINYMRENGLNFLKSQGFLDINKLKIESIMVTNKVFFSRYKKIEFDIMSVHEFEQKIFNLYNNNDKRDIL